MRQEEKPKTIKDADEKLVDLMFKGLDHGIECIKTNGKGPLIPFSMMETNGHRKLIRFVADKLEDGLSEGINELKKNKNCEFGILVYDGFVTIEEHKYDAVIVKGFDRKDNIGFLMGQRYEPKKLLRKFKLIGNATYLGTEEQLLR
jgi:hypothetical protein